MQYLILAMDTGWLADSGLVTLVTGSGGALVVLILWVKSLSGQLKKKDEELMEISKQSIECITKILERHNQDKEWRNRLEDLMRQIQSSLPTRHSEE